MADCRSVRAFCTDPLHLCPLTWHWLVLQNYGRELNEAYECTQKYRISRKEAELHQAWDLYYHVFKRINKQLPSLTVLELQYVAPALVRAQVMLTSLSALNRKLKVQMAMSCCPCCHACCVCPGMLSRDKARC